MKIGRPSKLNQELIDKIHKYHNYCIEASEIPYIERLEIQLDIGHETVSDWINKDSKKNESLRDLKILFAEAIKKIKKLQKLMLMEKLIKSNSIGAMFLLKTVHGFVETSKTINEHQGGVPVLFKLDMAGGYIPPQGAVQGDRVVDKSKKKVDPS